VFSEWLKCNSIIDLVKDTQSYHPYPKATEREKWDNIPEKVVKVCIQEAEKYFGFQWPSLPAVNFMAFMRTGNRRAYEDYHFPRRKALAALVLGECIEGKGRFIDDIINGIWCICEESFWGVSAHNGVRATEPLPNVEDRYIDLFAAETGALLAWTKYLLADELNKVTHLVTRRIDIELEERIKRPFIHREDFWWMGITRKNVNNWTPWITANVMSIFLLNEYDQIRRAKALEKMMRCLDRFMGTYHDDGGCDEGTSYWNVAGGALFDCLDQLYLASDGKIDFFSNELVRQIGRYIYRCHIADKYFINFADGGAKINIAKDMIYRYGKRIQDLNMISLAIGVPSNADFRTGALRRALPEIFNYKEFLNANAKMEPPYARDVWMDGIQVMVAREKGGSTEGLYLAAKGGHNAESHNHNDVGSCIIFIDGLPGVIDIGAETYTKKTFSAQRYEIWTMQSQYHNVPTINEMMQQPGREYCASNAMYSMTEDNVTFSVDIHKAYPQEAGVKYYNRTYRMNRRKNVSEKLNENIYENIYENINGRIIEKTNEKTNKAFIEITDTYAFERESNTLSLNFMVWKKPEIINVNDGITADAIINDRITVDKLIDRLIKVEIDANTSFYMEFNKENTKVDIEHCDTSDEKLRQVWGDEGIYRIIITRTVPKEGSFSVRIYK
jgi:hypothetical protein